MSFQGGNSDSTRRYLLGELSEQEREQVEQRLMSDDDLYQQLLIAEDDLIDEYVSGTLPEHEREKFSRHFLTVPELRQDVRFAKALREHAVESAPRVPAEDSRASRRFSPRDWFGKFFMRPALGVSLAAALVVAVLFVAWLTARNSQMRRQAEQARARQTPPPAPGPDSQEQLAAERRRDERLSAELLRQQELIAEETRRREAAQEKPQPTPARGSAPRPPAAALVALTLTPGLVRDSGELKKIYVPPDAREVRIRLDLPAGGYRSYGVVLTTVDGREVWARKGLRDGRRMLVTLNVPAGLLGADDYQILLSGVKPTGESEEISNYYFRVSK